jgi:hypothetical protein
MASVLALVGFAAAAVTEAARGGALARAVPRLIVAAVAMGVVGLIAGSIAERAVSEAVDSREPAYIPPEPEMEIPTEDTEIEEE